MLEGQPAPSHSTISKFQNRIGHVMEELFSQLVLALIELNELDYTNIFIDGTKIEANANKYTFVWRKVCEKNFPKLEEKIICLINEVKRIYPHYHAPSNRFTLDDLEELLTFLNQEILAEKIEFVHGSGKHKHPLQKTIESLSTYIQKWSMYKDYLSNFGNRNSFSKTDIDATFMHMKEDHMRNSQLKPGYNLQIGVSGEYIVGVDIFNERSDHYTLTPFLERLKNNYPKTWLNIIADAGYESEENYKYLKVNEYGIYIKPANHEQTKKRSFKKKIGRRENMSYNPESDTFTCAGDKKLYFTHLSTRKSKSGFESEIRNYECEDCSACSLRSKCTKAKLENNKRISFSSDFNVLRNLSSRNIKSEEGIVLRMNRSIQVEGAFGVIKQDFGFKRFLTRGKDKVRIEFLLLAFAYNIKKYHNKHQNNRNGVLFYHKEVA